MGSATIYDKIANQYFKNHLLLVDQDQDICEEKIIENSIAKSNPYGDIDWVKKVAKIFSLEQTLWNAGRPKNGG